MYGGRTLHLPDVQAYIDSQFTANKNSDSENEIQLTQYNGKNCILLQWSGRVDSTKSSEYAGDPFISFEEFIVNENHKAFPVASIIENFRLHRHTKYRGILNRIIRGEKAKANPEEMELARSS